YYSFTDYKIGKAINWDGLENYRELILGEGAQGRRFKQALFNSFYYALIGVPLQILAALSMAMLLNRNIPGIKFFRTTFYLPVILAGSPAALLAWRYMLASNGGFINVTLQRVADAFFIFDYLYRFFIFAIEGFNGFYTGISRGDPVGPLKYALPAFFGVFLLLTLLGDWSEGKRVFAWRSAQVLSIIILAFTLPAGIVHVPVNVSWTYFAGLVVLGGILINASQGKITLRGTWQIAALLLFAISFGMTLEAANFKIHEGNQNYLLAIVIAVIPIIASFYGKWTRQKFFILGGVAALLGLIIFIRAIPGQLDGGRLGLLLKYLTFQSALEDKSNLDYLEALFAAENMSALWIYGLVVVVLVGLALLGHTYERGRRVLAYGALAFFALMLMSSLMDGRGYFQAYEDIAEKEGKPVYHFAIFRSETGDFPDSSEVPLWMTNELWAKPSLILITMWSSGAGMLIFLAALKGVPRQLYEAAEVDGANGVQKFFKITLPLISPAMFYNIVIGIIAALQTFESIYILQRPDGNQDSLMSAAFFLFVRTFRQLDIGQGAAASWILATIIVVLTVLQFRWSSWVNYEV
ncbi:MAG: ABC transporter permease subunit, partial [Anaerolineae bacterium]|nr:ABC transporter permease subunit [Anaerolineae bacterium]